MRNKQEILKEIKDNILPVYGSPIFERSVSLLQTEVLIDIRDTLVNGVQSLRWIYDFQVNKE